MYRCRRYRYIYRGGYMRRLPLRNATWVHIKRPWGLK
jgi:hypothetical protein